MLINSPPKPTLLASDFNDDLVQMPNISQRMLSTPKMSSDLWSEFDSPSPARFVRNVNTAFEEHFLNFTQAEIEANVEPDRVGDDFGREAMTFVADGRCLHRPQLRPNCRANNKSGVNVTTPGTLL